MSNSVAFHELTCLHAFSIMALPVVFSSTKITRINLESLNESKCVKLRFALVNSFISFVASCASFSFFLRKSNKRKSHLELGKFLKLLDHFPFFCCFAEFEEQRV